MKDGKQRDNARIIMQGFTLEEAMTKKLESKASTSSKLGQNIVNPSAAAMRWKLFRAGARTASLQADDIVEQEGLLIFGLPATDVRRRLERTMDPN